MNTSKITSLCPETAKMLLGNFSGVYLYLPGLTTLDAETAKALSKFKGDELSLHGLTTLDAETAKALAEFNVAVLYLNGLTVLDADTAKALAEFKGDTLYLDGLTTLDAATAKALSGFNGTLYVCKEVNQLIKNSENPPIPASLVAFARTVALAAKDSLRYEVERLRLTAAEREAVEWAAREADQWEDDEPVPHQNAATLRGLLERTK